MPKKTHPNTPDEKIYHVPESRIQLHNVYFVITDMEKEYNISDIHRLVSEKKRRACRELANHIQEHATWNEYVDQMGHTVYRLHYNLLLPPSDPLQ